MRLRRTKSTTKPLITLFTLIMLMILFIFPTSSLRGAENGLLLWFNILLPNLLPFMIISNLIIELRLTKYFAKLFYYPLHLFFRVTRHGCYPIVIGLLTGFPVGAKVCGDLVSNHLITREEGQYLLTFCNNASPSFIISYIAISSLNLPGIKYSILLIIYAAAILSSLVFRLVHFLRYRREVDFTSLRTASVIQTSELHSEKLSFRVIDKSIQDAFEVVTKVGGYVILFSILSYVIMDSGLLPNLMNQMVVGLMEITNGINVISHSGNAIELQIALILALTAFGGFSSIAQTKSVIDQTGLSIKTYIIYKLINALFTLALVYLFLLLL